MLLRDRLLARMAEMGGDRDDARLAREVLGIRNAPPELARRLVEQALVVEDRREAWIRLGTEISDRAPAVPGVYVLRGSDGRALYVGKANNLRRRLRTHFAERRWRAVKPELTRTASVEWHEVGSEIEALVLEAEWIRDLSPVVNVQVSAPDREGRAVPAALWRDTLLVLPSAEAERVVIVAVRADGPVLMIGVRRDGGGGTEGAGAEDDGLREVAARLRRFFGAAPSRADRSESGSRRGSRDLAPLVFSWLAGRGASSTRLDPHDAPSARELQRRLALMLGDEGLFTERIVVIRSRFRTTSKRP